MKFLNVLLVKLGLRHVAGPRIFELDEPLHAMLSKLAEQEHRPPEELASDLLAAGLAQRQARQVLVRSWDGLSAREQEVTALTCLGYTNRQIASRLGVAEETVKTHVKNALIKFNLHGKGELRKSLEDWDFSAFGKREGES